MLTRSRLNIILLAVLGFVLILLTLSIARTSPPNVKTEFGGATVEISADKAWSLFSGDCVTIRWNLEGIKSIYIDGQGEIGLGEIEFCPSLSAASPQLEITAQDGSLNVFTLDIHYLPSELLICLLFVIVILPFALALTYVTRRQLDNSLPIGLPVVLVLTVAVIACLLGLASGLFSIRQILRNLADLFASPLWQVIGLVLAGVVFIPLLFQSIWRGIRTKARSDFVAIAGFFVFLLLLYLPFGFESIGHWEEWVVNAYFEGRPSKLSVELVSRFWEIVPHSLAYLINSDTFVGYHVLNLLMFLGKLALLYGILRHLRFSLLYAFLTTMLFMVYPVNSGLMSLRSFPMQFSMLALLVAVYLILDYVKNPSRLHILGIWLSLIFNITSNESAYAILLIVPLLWWLRERKFTWRNFNLTAIWYLFPMTKIAYILLLLTSGQPFHNSRLFVDPNSGGAQGSAIAENFVGDLLSTYQHTFVDAWAALFPILDQESWISWSTVMLALVALVAIYLARGADSNALPTSPQAACMMISGLLFVTPAVGVLIWVELYRLDPWRMYFYVPIGASIAVFALLSLLTLPIRRAAYRIHLIIVLFIVLMFPSLNRLLYQHESYISSANAKAQILIQMLRQAPAIDDSATVILLTDKSRSELKDVNIAEFQGNMLDSAIHVLYEKDRPQFAFLCYTSGRCSPSDIELYAYHFDEFTAYDNLVIFRVYDDLSVELLREFPKELGLDDQGAYNVDGLVDTSAPLPPRAITMLANSLD